MIEYLFVFFLGFTIGFTVAAISLFLIQFNHKGERNDR